MYATDYIVTVRGPTKLPSRLTSQPPMSTDSLVRTPALVLPPSLTPSRSMVGCLRIQYNLFVSASQKVSTTHNREGTYRAICPRINGQIFDKRWPGRVANPTMAGIGWYTRTNVVRVYQAILGMCLPDAWLVR